MPVAEESCCGLLLLLGATMSGLTSVCIRDCRSEEVESVLELWRQAEATPSVTDNADDWRGHAILLRRRR
jgi:hypothetical protein